MDKNELYRIKDELLKSKAQDLEQIEDHKEYAMRADEQRDFMEKQMEHDAIKAANESEERFRKMQEMGNYRQEIKQIYEKEEIKKQNR